MYGAHVPATTRKADCAVAIMEAFPLNPPEAFLLLGKDGMALRSLGIQFRLSMKYVQNPQSLIVEGKAIVEDVFELPENKPIGSHLFQPISRLSGAYLTSFGESKVFLSSGNAVSGLDVFSVGSSSVAFPHDYALYPFLSPRSLSWTVSASGVFRMRRVEDWLGNGVSEDLRQTGGLLKGGGRIMSLQLKESDLRQSLLADILPPASNSSRAVIASSCPFDLPAKLAGEYCSTGAIARTMEASHQVLHRLIYRSVNGVDDAPKIIKVEVVLPRTVEESLATDPALGRPRCWVGQRLDLDVLMPDRPADIRFSVLDSIDLAPGQWPVVLEEYLSTLRAFQNSLSYQDPDASQPEAPLSFRYQDVNYVLQSNSSVRQNIERTDTAGSPSVKVVTESSLDLEGNHKSASCEVRHSFSCSWTDPDEVSR
ncbi:hypothetical protein B0H16DRAFT_1446179 [Mycena metata]|uniref:Uncharacterized protein n=1 Tax=Mycena metata TaxID=1033252 RepID=A0AAD7KIN7_9AGAR|nr:hypothetical protein B0H16DRAFT_1446179 [Mycena metata]